MNFLNRAREVYVTTKAKPWQPEKPIVIQFPVNDVCNSRCQMCNIWQQKFDYQITPAELKVALSNPLFSNVRTVGVNGGEPTLRKDLAELVDVLFTELPSLSGIALITNSFNSEQVIDRIQEVGQVVRSHSGRLGVMVSLDGVGEIHDLVRGRPGNFSNAVKVIDFIQNSDFVTSRRLGCTVIKDNVYDLHNLLEFAISKNIYIKYRLGIPHQRLYSQDVTDPFALSFPEKYHFAIFLENLIKYYEKSEAQNYFYRSLIGQLMYAKPRTANCDWQHRGVTLSARGELLYCAVESKVLGSAVTEDAEHLHDTHKDHLADIVRTKCDSCTHDYVGLPPTKVLLKTHFKNALNKFGLSPNTAFLQKPLVPIKILKQKAGFQRRLSSFSVSQSALAAGQAATKFSVAKNEKRKVLICGWYGTETLGDKAILGGIVNSIRSYFGEFDLYLSSLEPYISEMTVLQMPELSGCTICSILDAVNQASSMDLVIFGGGPLMALDQLADMLAMFQKASEANVPTLVAGCGVGPLGADHHNQAIKFILQHASFRIYRDLKSLDMARDLGIDTTHDYASEDPAFTWLCHGQTDSIAKQESHDRPRLLLGLRDWPYRGYARELGLDKAKQMKAHFEAEIISALEQLLDLHPDLEIVPFPMGTNYTGDDRWFYRDLFRNCPTLKKAIDFTCLGVELSPLEAVKVFRSTSAALTMRFHSLVFAIALEVPCVAIDYTMGKGKVRSVAEKYHVSHKSLDKIDAKFMVDSLSPFLGSSQKSTESEKEIGSTLTFPSVVSSCLTALNHD